MKDFTTVSIFTQSIIMALINFDPVSSLNSVGAGSQVLDNQTSLINGQTSDLAVNLLFLNNGQPVTDAFPLVSDDTNVAAMGDSSALEEILYRVNVGGPEIAAIDAGIVWSADTSGNNSPFLIDPGSNHTASFPALEPGPAVLNTTPDSIFDTERWDQEGGSEMQWTFDVEDGLYNVRLYLGNSFEGTSETGERVFDVAIERTVPSTVDNIDLSHQFGHLVGGVINNTVPVFDGKLNLEFLHGTENPLINGIEILKVGDAPPTTPAVSIVGGPYIVGESDNQVQISLVTDVTIPSAESVDVTFEITPGTATAQEDYEYLSATATFNPQTGTYTDTVSMAGSSSVATFLIDILQDTITEPNEAFAVKITDVSPNAEIDTIRPVSVTITEGETPDRTPLQVEAEDITNITGYRIEQNAIASGRQMLSLVGQAGDEVGSATFGFKSASGQYDVVIGTFDENDGRATLKVTQNGNIIGSNVLDQDLGGNAATAATYVERTIATGVTIANGDSFTVTGLEEGSEHARFDFIRFEPTLRTPGTTPVDVNETPEGTLIRLEAESLESIANYRIENIDVGSGGQVLTFIGGSANEKGSATFGFDEVPGTYDIRVGTFDENDGVAQFVVELNDAETSTTTEIGMLKLDASLGSNLANAQTFISPTVAAGVNLTSGDQIIVNGFENGNEHARLDYIELVPVI